MSEDFCPYGDCEHYQAYDEGDDYPPVIKCEKANEWIEDHLPCYKCESKWSAEQIRYYIASEEAKEIAREQERR